MGKPILSRYPTARNTTAWMDRAACIGEDQNLFFIERGASSSTARSICAACPVRDTCLDYAITNSIHHGIWGGLSERQRRRIRRAHATEAAGG